MWISCPRVLDEPVQKWGFEFDDLMIIGALPAVLIFLVSPWVCFGVTLAVAGVIYYGKRGKPPGAILHWLHAMELIRLPGVLSPRPQRYSPW
jgi:type IV secretory pathway TrbD component